MPSQRTFELTLLGASFAPLLVVPIDGWSPTGTQLANQMRLVSEERLGRFRPNVLGRGGKLFATAIVWCNGPVSESDQIQVLSSSDDVDGLPINVVRRVVPLTTSPETAEVILLGPTDDIGVRFETDGTAGTVHVMVNDLEEDELFRWFTDRPVSDACCAVVTRTISGGDQTLDAWTGALFLNTTLTDPGAVLTLPPSADLAVGASVFIARSTAGAWLRVVGGAGDSVNGATAPEGVDIHNANQGEIFRLSAGGRWLSTAYNGIGDLLAATNAVVGASVPIAAWQGDRELVVNFTASGTLVLPSAMEIAIGQRLIIVRNPAGAAQIRIECNNPGAEGMNGAANGAVWLEGPNSTMWLERVIGGWSAMASHELGVINAPETITSAGATLEPWAGDKYVQLAIVAGGATQLPLIADTPEGSRLWVARTGGTTQHRVEAQGGDIFNGVAGGGVNLVLGAPMLEIVQVGGRWETVGMPLAADETETISSATVLTDGWVGLRCFTILAAVLLTLPAAATLSVGTQALILPSIAGTSVSGGASNISFGGVLGASISPTLNEPILLIWNGTAWCGV